MIFCVIDTETTGLRPGHHEVIEAAAILCDEKLDEIGRTSYRVRPDYAERASKVALQINGYNPRTWNPTFSSHKKALISLNDFVLGGMDDSGELVLVGQNIKFDQEFIREECKEHGVPFLFDVNTLDLIDVAKIWTKVKNKKISKFGLDYLCEYTGIVNENPHSAEADAETTLEILRYFVDDLRKESKHVRRGFSKKSKIKV